MSVFSLRRILAGAVLLVVAALTFQTLFSGTTLEAVTGNDSRAAWPVSPPAAAQSAAPPLPLSSLQRAQFFAEAEQTILMRLGGERTARFGNAVLVDVRQRIVCGEVVPLGRGAGLGWKRYVSFGGTGIAIIDDGSAAFAEIHLSACTTGPSRRN